MHKGVVEMIIHQLFDRLFWHSKSSPSFFFFAFFLNSISLWRTRRYVYVCWVRIHPADE